MKLEVFANSMSTINQCRLVVREGGAYYCMKQRGPSHKEEEKLNPFFSKLPQSSATTSKFIAFFTPTEKTWPL